MTKEHVWPDWLHEILPPEVAKQVVTLTFNDSHLGHVRTFTQPLFELTYKDVCEQCNSGWMSRYEGAVKPIISGMLLGRGKRLHEAGQTTVAAWGTLKALAVQHTFPRRELVLPEHYTEIYDLRDEIEPPKAVKVAIGKTAWSADRAKPAFFHLNGMAPSAAIAAREDQVDGYLATFSVLDLVFHVFRIYEHTDRNFDLPDPLGASMQHIWPIRRSSFNFPPGPALTDRGLDMISGAAAAGPRG